MSDSSQPLNRLILFFLLFLLSESAIAYQITAYPDILYFTAIKEESCQKVNIYSDPGTLTSRALWSKKPSKNLLDYQYSSNEIEIEVNVPEKITSGEQEIQICLKTHDSKRYNGVLIIESKEKSAGIGIWLIVNKDSESKEPKIIEAKSPKTSLITGKVILEPDNFPSAKIIPLLIGEAIFLLSLLIIFITTYKILRKRRVKNLY